MTGDEADSYMMGGMVDESFSADAVRDALDPVIDRIDVAAFEAFLAPELGRYRDMVDAAVEQPGLADEMRLVDEALEAVEQARLRLTHLPPSADAYANEVCWHGRGELYFDFSQRLASDLVTARALLIGTEQKLAPFKGMSGAKSKSLRDCLLRDVAHWLQDADIGKEKAAGVAAAVLRATGITAPDNPRKAREIVLKLEAPENSR